MKENIQPRFYIYASYYGAINQLPFVVKALLQEMPSADIVYNVGDFHDETESSIERKISNLFRFQGLELEQERLRGAREGRIDISFPIQGKKLEIDELHKRVEIPVDPLKFEKRILLNEEEKEALRQKYKIKAKEVLCVGSMKSNDVEDVYAGLKERCRDDFQAILVPRQLSVMDEFLRTVKWYDYDSHSSPEFKVKFSSKCEYFDNQDYNILMVDEVGLLADLYSISTVAYVCDTHWASSYSTGQNPLEPAFYGVRIISGPTWKCNAEAFEGLRDSGLLKIVESQRELVSAIKYPLTEDELRMCQKNAADFIKSKQGYAKNCAQKIKRRFEF